MMYTNHMTHLICLSCGGFGHHETKDKPCKHCRQTGKVTVRQAELDILEEVAQELAYEILKESSGPVWTEKKFWQTFKHVRASINKLPKDVARSLSKSICPITWIAFQKRLANNDKFLQDCLTFHKNRVH